MGQLQPLHYESGVASSMIQNRKAVFSTTESRNPKNVEKL